MTHWLSSWDISVDTGFGRSSTLVELAEAWSGHVIRLHKEATSTAGVATVWGVHDFIAALYIRDFLAKGLDQAGAAADDQPQVVAAADALFCSFCARDEGNRLLLIDPEAPTSPWWWTMLPTAGQVLREIEEVEQRLGNPEENSHTK